MLLFEAERAWAHSQELKQESFDKEQNGDIRRHGLSRSQRGVQWSKSLLELLTALGPTRVDAMTRAEATAYHTLLQGFASFDKNSFQACVEQLSVARKLLYAIAESSGDSRKEALANSYVDSTEAMLRFCAYNLDIGEQDMDTLAGQLATKELCERVVPGFEELVKQLGEKKGSEASGDQVRKLVSVEWHGKQIAVRNPELVDVILRVQGVEEKLRASLKDREESGEKGETDKRHKRQRLTSAQRSAKKRTNGASSDAPTAATSAAAKTFTTSSKTEMDGYDSLLAALTEAEDTARRLVQDNTEALAKSHSSRYEAASTDLVNAHEYLLYKLLSVRIERNVNLVAEVQEKGKRRQQRVKDIAEKRLHALAAGNRTRKEGTEPVRRRIKPEKRKIRPAGARPKKAKTTARGAKKTAFPRTSKKPSANKRQEEERLHRKASLKMQRIAARSVPGVAKLLDACEMSCTGINTLGLVESDANVSTLMEAKSAWYKSELLRFLARSFAWNGEYDKSLLLLNRSELFVREARSAMELVDDSEAAKENGEVKPVMEEATFAQSEAQIEEARRTVQRDVLVKQRSGAVTRTAASRGTPSQSKANIAIHDMATKYVDFDPVDLAQALYLSPEREADLLAEGKAAAEGADDNGDKAAQASNDSRHVRQISMATTTVSDDFDDRLVGTSNDTGGAYDPGNLVEEEEEEESATGKKAGWLGGWFAKK